MEKRRVGNKPQETLNDREQTMGWLREVGGGWARWGMGTNEGTCWDEHWVYVSDESLILLPKSILHCMFTKKNWSLKKGKKKKEQQQKKSQHKVLEEWQY